MTKKLSKWEKGQNKQRRMVLVGIKNLLKDKSVRINYNIEHELARNINQQYVHTGNNTLILTWCSKITRKRGMRKKNDN